MKYDIVKQNNSKSCRIQKGLRFCISVLFLGIASGCAFLDGTPDPPKAANPTGVSGRINPEAEQLFAKAHILWGRGEICSDPEQAISYLEQALIIEPDYADALQRRALALSQLGYAEEAFEDATKAIRLNPSADAYASRGLCLIRQNNFKGARQDLDQAIRLQQTAHRAYNFRGALSWQENRIEEACADMKQGCSNGDCEPLELARTKGICK